MRKGRSRVCTDSGDTDPGSVVPTSPLVAAPSPDASSSSANALPTQPPMLFLVILVMRKTDDKRDSKIVQTVLL